MRENNGFFSFAFDSAHVKYGVWTWPWYTIYYYDLFILSLIKLLIVSITKFSIVIGSPRAYFSRNQRRIQSKRWFFLLWEEEWTQAWCPTWTSTTSHRWKVDWSRWRDVGLVLRPLGRSGGRGASSESSPRLACSWTPWSRTPRRCKRDYILCSFSMACLLFPVLSRLAVAEGWGKSWREKKNVWWFFVGSMLKNWVRSKVKTSGYY